MGVKKIQDISFWINSNFPKIMWVLLAWLVILLFAYIYCRTNSIVALYAVLTVGAVSQKWHIGAILFAIIAGSGMHLIRKRLIKVGNQREKDSPERDEENPSD